MQDIHFAEISQRGHHLANRTAQASVSFGQHAPFGFVWTEFRSPSNCRRNKSILARQLRATKTDIGHTPILSNETVSYYSQYVAKDFSWLSDRRSRCFLVWKRAGLRVARAFPGFVVPIPSAAQPRPVVAAFRAISGRIRLNTILSFPVAPSSPTSLRRLFYAETLHGRSC